MRSARAARQYGRTSFTVAIAERDAIGTEILTSAEQREYNTLRYDGRRRDWLAGRAAAKHAVARRCGVSIDRLRLDTVAGAAPSCSLLTHGAWKLLPVRLSIAHCDGLAIAAASDHATAIGVDVDREGAIAFRERARYLSSRERARPGLDATLAWVLKEAAWKALRLGPELPFASLELDLTNDARLLRRVRVKNEWHAARACLVRLPRSLGMLAAVVALEAA